MGISLSMQLGDATLAELAALVKAAQAAGVDLDTKVRVSGDHLVIDVSEFSGPEVVEGEPVAPSGADALRDTVRQVLSEEAVRGVFESFITKNSQRKP